MRLRFYDDRDWQREVTAIDAQGKDWRPPARRDHGRIIHSASFRRQQGKTQVFPGRESDFFRNRLTHSLEVSQIAEGIAERINHAHKEDFEGAGIDGRLCAAAGLVHDIGHPPFGHNGERALDDVMLDYGGFEGNAQTLRILARLEKKARYKIPVTGDDRAGLGLCYRTLAAVLKYDNRIPSRRERPAKLSKGYYDSEAEIVDNIKSSVLNGRRVATGKFKTIECSIMDVADDIAYSVYDLEDCLKVGFLTPVGILSSPDDLLDAVAARVKKATAREIRRTDVMEVLADVFAGIVGGNQSTGSDDKLVSFIESYRASRNLGEDGYYRTAFSSQLVHEFITGVEFHPDENCPPLSWVSLPDALKLKVEVLKQYTFETAIYSARVKMGEFRGTEVVKGIVKALREDKGDLLMPDDVRHRYNGSADEADRARTVCDFVAGMTDRYAMEFWARLNSDGGESMFKPI